MFCLCVSRREKYILRTMKSEPSTDARMELKQGENVSFSLSRFTFDDVEIQFFFLDQMKEDQCVFFLLLCL